LSKDMRLLALLAVLICVGYAAAAAGRVDILVLDTFESNGDQNSCSIQLNDTVPSNTFPLIDFSSFSTGNANSAALIGGERDLQLTALTGVAFSLYTSDVSFGQWSLSTPSQASSQALLQYDGIDGSINLNTKGFEAITGASGGYDLTVTSKADGLHLTIVTDLDTQYTFNIYDVNGGSSTLVNSAVGGDITDEVQLLFTSFKGNVDYTKVGAIEVRIEGLDNVDTATTLFALSGPTAVAPSASSVPPPPGASKTPGNGFTWYTVDDDFDRLPCADEPPRRSYFVSNENIVYYYFYKFDEYINAYQGSQIIIEISSSSAISFSLFAGLIALLVLS